MLELVDGQKLVQLTLANSSTDRASELLVQLTGEFVDGQTRSIHWRIRRRTEKLVQLESESECCV